MAVRDNSKIQGLFIDSVDLYIEEEQPKEAPKKPSSFAKKLANEDYHLFEINDWFKYFAKKAEDNGYVSYADSKDGKSRQIIKGLMCNYTPQKIKALIDFLWDVDHNIHDKRTMGIWILASGWRQSVMPLFDEYVKNGYISNGRKQREWRPEKEPESKSGKGTKKTTISIGGDD